MPKLGKIRKRWGIFLIFICLWGMLSGWVIYKRRMYIWLWDYIQGRVYNLFSKRQIAPKHIIFCFVDHFEPYFNTDDDKVAEERVKMWWSEYPRIASKHKDADGNPPQHTWFYPEEMIEKNPSLLKYLIDLERKGYGEIEMHLHHQDDTENSFRKKIIHFKETIGYLEKGKARKHFAYIAGNWALDNSRLERGKNYSGVNNELIVLNQEGCFADFTFPSIGQLSQPAKVNSIYYAKDDPLKPKSYNRGKDVKVGGSSYGDLLIIEGPLAITWYYFWKKFRPSIDDGNICDTYLPFKERVDTWVKCNIHVKGRPEWIFIKIFTHGCEDKTIPVVLGKPIDEMFTYLETKYNDGKKYILHYVTAREMYNIIKAAEAGLKGNPDKYRDFIIKPYIRR